MISSEGKAFPVLVLLIAAASACAQEIKSFQYHGPRSEVPIGATCYDMSSQLLLDLALESGMKCQGTLAQCRKWRDKYKTRLRMKCPDNDLRNFQPEFADLQISKKKPIVFAISGVLIGLIFGGIVF